MTEQKHSEHYFNETRDFWWNKDFLSLMAERWKLKSVRKALDVGCGVGHWGQLLSAFIRKDATIHGIDQEKEWIQQATKRAENITSDQSFHYQVGTAESLPFEDNSFDLVTCQTVLIHLKDPAKALKEFYRVVKPGGLVAVAEPNNLANSVIRSNLSFHDPVEDLVKQVKFTATCERGKRNLGEGDDSLGDLIPGLLHESGLKDIKCYLSDKCSMIIPPYDKKEAKALTEHILTSLKEEIWIWNKKDTKRYFLSGGGKESEFESFWKSCFKDHDKMIEALKNESFHSTCGTMMYLVSGRKN